MTNDDATSVTGSSRGRLSLPFVLSLAAGILIIINSSIMAAMMAGNWGFMGGMMMDGGGMMGGAANSMLPFNNLWPLMMGVMMAVGIISGILVLIGALMMNKRPSQTRTWGIIVLIFSIIAFFGGGGGFLIGTIAGVIGGALAISRSS